MLRKAQAASLRFTVAIGRDVGMGNGIAKLLMDFGAGVGQVKLFVIDDVEADITIDDAIIDPRGAAFGGEHFVLFAPRPQRNRGRWRAPAAVRVGHARGVVRDYACMLRDPRPLRGAIERRLQARLRQIAGGGITATAFDHGRQHRATIVR